MARKRADAPDATSYRYQFVAGNLALDFVNTIAYRFDRAKKKDHFQSAEEVRRWAIQAQLPDRRAINACSPITRSALSWVQRVREQLFTIFHAVACGERISAGSLRLIDLALRDCRAKQCLSVRGAQVRWTWRLGTSCSDFLLYPILTAASDLLTSGSWNLVRRCADEHCGWLFLDRSNAHKRRWCRMADCGNRNKAREHYRRKAGAV
jgi:predicted RNA-binding Zn ribbon-like protein